MKNYLDFVRISAKVRRRQSRMTRFCIILAVFLVSGIFSMADMEIRSQRQQSIMNDGAWHAMFPCVTDEQAALIAARPEVVNSSRYEVTNYNVNMGYTLEGKETGICGFDESMLELYPSLEITEGSFPTEIDEVVVTQSVQMQAGVQLGNLVTLQTPDGDSLELTVCGFFGDTSLLTQRDAFCMFFNVEGYENYFTEATQTKDRVFYVEFTPWCNIQKTISDICTQLNIDKSTVGQNVKLLALMLQSNDMFMLQLYAVAAILAVLVMVAGILMISSSLNSNVADRTAFFGMMRCLGATPKQVIRLVRREAMALCKTSIPIGMGISVLVVWSLCGLLRYLSPTYFAGIPVFGISWLGLAGGALIGLATVLLAVRSPAKRASKVSPLTAVSGNARTIAAKKAANTRILPVEVTLGVHHAIGSKKNFLLMTGSFAFSIILFLSFSPAIDFMNHAITPLQPYTPDVSVVSPDNTCSVPASLLQEIVERPAVKRAYGRSFAYDMPVQINGSDTAIMLISYEENQFRWAEDMLMAGSIQAAKQGKGVLIEKGSTAAFSPGDTITIHTPAGLRDVSVVGVLSYTQFSREEGQETVICSESLFQELTGERNYTIIDAQLNDDATDGDVDTLRKMAGDELLFSDRRMSNSETRGAYYAFALFLYGFLAVIALIAMFHIVNSIAMSVSARMKQYGAMRAIGMSSKQLLRMVAAEAITYVFWGIVLGCTVGLLLNRQLYLRLVTYRWGEPWYVPVGALGIILVVVILSVLWAIYAPAKRIRSLSIVDTISGQ